MNWNTNKNWEWNVPELVDESANIIENQKQDITKDKNYYKILNPKKKRMHTITLNNAVPHNNIPELSESQRASKEGEITFIELRDAIQRMKND